MIREMRKFKRKFDNESDRSYPYLLEFYSTQLELKSYKFNNTCSLLKKSIESESDKKKPLFKKRYMLSKITDNT